MLILPSIAKDRLASEEGLCSMDLVSELVYCLVSQSDSYSASQLVSYVTRNKRSLAKGRLQTQMTLRIWHSLGYT